MSPILGAVIVIVMILMFFYYIFNKKYIDTKKGDSPVAKTIKVSFYNERDEIEFVKLFQDEPAYYAGDGDWMLGESAYEQFKDYLKESKKFGFFIVDSTGVPHANVTYFEVREL